MKKRILTALLCTALLTTLLSGCNKKEEKPETVSAPSETEEAKGGGRIIISEQAATSGYDIAFAQEDTLSETASDAVVNVTLKNNTADISGKGAIMDKGSLLISAAGTYRITGELSGGQIHINAGKDAVVTVLLDQVSVTNTGAALYAEKCKKTVLLLKDGTQNSFADSARTIDEDADEPDAAVFAKGDLSITGTGSLTVNGNAKNGITSKDILRISGGSIDVTAENHGITGKDDLAVIGGTLQVTAKCGDGLRTNNSDTEKDDLGHISLENANITVQSGKDAIQADKTLTVGSGTLSLTTGGGADKAPVSSGMGFGFGGRDTQRGTTDSATEESKESRKGLKAGTAIILRDGSITADTYDDAIHSNGSVLIAGGELSLRAGDDGVHADTILDITGGTLNIAKSYEGLEAIQIHISDGTVDLTASDDGINSAGGNDSSGFGNFDGSMDFGGRRRNPMAEQSQESTQTDASQEQNSSSYKTSPQIIVSGGTLCVNAGGDGLDSNSSLDIKGGTVIINGPKTGGNGIIDHDGSCAITGGLLIGAGTSDMLEMPGSSSTQKTVAVILSQTQKAGSLIYIVDSAGAVTAAMTPEIDYGCLIFNSSKLTEGETYTVMLGGTASGENLHGYYTKATVSGGTQFTQFTLSGNVTYVNENGVTTDGNSGRDGFGGRGSFQPGQKPEISGDFQPGQRPEGQIPEMPEDFQPGQKPEISGDFQPGQRPDGQMPEMPEGFQPGQRPDGQASINQTQL